MRQVVAALCRRRAHGPRGASARLAARRSAGAGTPLELIERLTGALRSNASVLYLAGRDRKGAIEAALSGTFALEVVEAYAAEARLSWRPREARALASCVAALHYSRRSAALAGELAKVSGEAERFLELRHFCLSGDVAEPLKALGAARIAVAETPDEAGLFHAVIPRPARVSFPWGLPYIRPRKIEDASRWSTRKPRTLRPDGRAPGQSRRSA